MIALLVATWIAASPDAGTGRKPGEGAPAKATSETIGIVEVLYQKQQFEAAELAVSMGLGKTGLSNAERVQLLIFEGMLHLEAVREAQALQSFKRALELDLKAKLPGYAPPKALRLIEDLRVKMTPVLPVPPSKEGAAPEDGRAAGGSFRTIVRWQGYSFDQSDNGRIAGRAVSIQKLSRTTGLRVMWSDDFRVSSPRGACRWEVLFNGSPCTNPGGLYFDRYEGSTNTSRNDPGTFIGTCLGLAPGWYNLSTRVGPSPEHGGGDCSTGWNRQLSSLEVEEVY